MGNVESTLDGVATISPANQADLAFPVSGTVSAVDVSVGQHVSVGQDVASLDTTPLAATVTTDEANVANAKARLSAAEASETATTTDSQATTGPTTSGATSTGGSGTTGNSAAISADQSALLAAERTVDSDQAQTTRDLTAAVTACGGTVPASSSGSAGTTPPPSTTGTSHFTSVSSSGTSTGSGSGTSGTSTGSGSGTSGTSTGSGSGTSGTGSGSGTSGTGTGSGSGTSGTGSGTSTAACTAALEQVSAGEKAVTQDITTLEKAESTLSGALKQSSGSAASFTSGGPSGTAGATSGSSSGKGTGTGQPTAAPATPQELALDQAQIDLDNADLATARQSLDDATLTSPIAGTVASVGMTAGQSVTAGGSSSSTADDIVVLGPGSFEATTPIPVSDLPEVHLGQAATVTPLATGHAVPATVTAIGLLATTTNGTTTYPVTLTLDATNLDMLSGADGDVAIVLAKASHVVTVPTSAVSTIGSTHFVTTYVNGKATRTRVDVGTVGAIRTQVTSGLHAGADVVLANLSEPLPTSGTTATGRAAGGAGGFGGAGRFSRG